MTQLSSKTEKFFVSEEKQFYRNGYRSQSYETNLFFKKSLNCVVLNSFIVHYLNLDLTAVVLQSELGEQTTMKFKTKLVFFTTKFLL